MKVMFKKIDFKEKFKADQARELESRAVRKRLHREGKLYVLST